MMESSGMRGYHCGSTSRGVDTVQVMVITFSYNEGEAEDDNDLDIHDDGDGDLYRPTFTLAQAGINTGATGKPLPTGHFIIFLVLQIGQKMMMSISSAHTTLLTPGTFGVWTGRWCIDCH